MNGPAATGRVQAAAKLVLQDLDPDAKKRRQEFMSGIQSIEYLPCYLVHVLQYSLYCTGVDALK